MELEYTSRAYGSSESVDVRAVEYIVCDGCAGMLPDHAGVYGICYNEYAEWECELCGTTVYGTGTAVATLWDTYRHDGLVIPEGDAMAAMYATEIIRTGSNTADPILRAELPGTRGTGQTIVGITDELLVIRDDDGTAISAWRRTYPRY